MNLYITDEMDVTDEDDLRDVLIARHPEVAYGELGAGPSTWPITRYASHNLEALENFLQDVYDLDQDDASRTIHTLRTIETKYVLTVTHALDTYEKAVEYANHIKQQWACDTRIDEKRV